MTQVNKATSVAGAVKVLDIADTGRIVVGASFKLLAPLEIQDASRIRVGASFALLPQTVR
jgi:hypothetical protein